MIALLASRQQSSTTFFLLFEVNIMQAVTIEQIPGERFPSGRHTRVFVGADSLLQAERFVSGFVVVDPGGTVPLHSHDQEEVYYILKGTGEMTVGEEVEIFASVAAIYIPAQRAHALKNIGDDELHLLFVYAPAGIVDHWQKERTGELS
jgi:quercetin dioxygenase-like cupin family protein